MKTKKLQFRNTKLLIGLFLLLMLAFAGCTGPEGPMGPMGPQGFDGADGTAFAYSVIYDVYPEDWAGNADGFRVYLDVPEIDDDIYYNGAVLVYRLIEIDPKSFNLLPYTYVDEGLTVYMDFDAYVGGIDLIYKEVFEGVNDTYAPADFMAFKVLIIEGIPLASLKGMVNINDVDAVTRFLKVENSFRKEVIL